MILVDTSVWIDHLRRGDAHLVKLLAETRVCVHPFVIGELGCGNLKARREVLELLSALPGVLPASDAEALHFLDQRQLMGRGIGYIDVHLLAATAIRGTARLWTRDKRLHAVAAELGLGYVEVIH